MGTILADDNDGDGGNDYQKRGRDQWVRSMMH